MRRALSNCSDADVLSFVSDGEGTISRAEFFELSLIPLDATETHFHFDPGQISQASIDLVRTSLNGCLIIGYELSEETRAVLDAAGLIYVDVWLHPIRFMDDNFFAYRSNSQEIEEALARYHLGDDVFYLYADKLKIQSYMGWDRYGGNLDKYLVPNAALFIGQTLTDKAVCRNGTMLNVLNFKDEFARLTSEHEHVYFSRHPLLVGSDDDQINFVTSFANASLIDEPGYKLLTADAITTVCAVSSSMVYESRFFGKRPQYFFKPVVPIRSEGRATGYASVFGRLHSPSFWRDLLAPHVAMRSIVPEYDFLKPHSNYRDMLALYYNTHVFDKEHLVYKRATEMPRQPATSPSDNTDMSDGFELNVVNFDRIRRLIDQHGTVSFDIFDTLLLRHLNVAGDVVKLVAKRASDRFGIDEEQFIKARREAKLHSTKREVPLEERYAILGQLLGLDESISEALFSFEIELERALLCERPVGKMLLRYAQSKRKRVIVTSDTYFDQTFVAEMLSREGISPDAFYLSRDHDATKDEGSLFTVVVDAEGADILHIGDNRKADHTNAVAAGLSAVWLISNRDQVKRSVPQMSLVPTENGYLSTIQNGIVINNLARYPAITRDAGYTQGTPRDLGFNVLGDIMLGFAAWIIGRAKAEGLSALFFLARDGEIVKRAVDSVLTATDDVSIKTHYLLASRRCVRVIALKTLQDVRSEAAAVMEEIAKNKQRSGLNKYISLRFGLNEALLVEIGLPQGLDAAKPATVSAFMSSEVFEAAVLDNAAIERDQYSRYLDSLEFPKEGHFAVVDIGHHGSLQASLAKIRGVNASSGYYFATYTKVDETLAAVPGVHAATGFYRDRTSSQNRDDNYIRYALMVEALFLNDKGTFLRFNEVDGELVPEFLEGDSDARFEFNRLVHSGALDYISKMIAVSKECFGTVDLAYFSGQADVCSRYFSMLKAGSVRDARTFSSITFENFFAGKEIRYLVPPASAADNREGIWREGTLALANNLQAKKKLTYAPKSPTMRARLVLAAFYLLLNPHLTKKERENYRTDPHKLFSKSKHPVMRFVGAAAGLRGSGNA